MRTGRLIYDLCEYLLHARDRYYEACQHCTEPLVSSIRTLPETLKEADYTEIRSNGWLTFPMVAAIKVVKVNESVISDCLKDKGYN